MLTAQKYLYESIKQFAITLAMEEDTFIKYRDLAYYGTLFNRAGQTVGEDKEPTLETYEAIIAFNGYVMPRIEIICKICNPRMLLGLTMQEIVDWFFWYNVPMAEPYTPK